MADVTLDQILAAPEDQAALQRHMNAIGVLSPVAAPTPMPGPTAALTRPTVATASAVPSSATVAPMTRPTFDSGHPSLPAPSASAMPEMRPPHPNVPEPNANAMATPASPEMPSTLSPLVSEMSP